MAEYLYKATTLTGQTVEGSMDGKDEETIVQSLHQLGYIPIRVLSAQEKRAIFPFALPPSQTGRNARTSSPSLRNLPRSFQQACPLIGVSIS